MKKKIQIYEDDFQVLLRLCLFFFLENHTRLPACFVGDAYGCEENVLVTKKTLIMSLKIKAKEDILHESLKFAKKSVQPLFSLIIVT